MELDNSEKSTIFQVIFYNNVSHSIHHKLYIIGVCCTRKMRVNVFCLTMPVESFESLAYVCTGFLVRIAACTDICKKGKQTLNYGHYVRQHLFPRNLTTIYGCYT